MHRTLFFLLLLCASCQQAKEVEPGIPCHLRYPHTCKPLVLLEGTKPDFKFLGNQQLNRLTHYLATQERVESQQIGFSGTFSEVYQAYEALQQQANLQDLTLLLRHPSPNVRYYALLGLAERDPKNKTTYPPRRTSGQVRQPEHPRWLCGDVGAALGVYAVSDF